MRSILSLTCFVSVAMAAKWADCDFENDVNPGPYGEPTFFNITYDKTVIYGYIPEGEGPFPLMGYMHGSTGEWGMYGESLKHFASHGFVVVFPHIKDPSGDTHWWTTNTDGKYLIKAIDWATAQNTVEGSDLFGKVDDLNVVFAGHSMGASCSIKGSHSQLDVNPNIKLTIAQHPGVCGPTGPPPLPATWMPNTLKDITLKHPVFFTTAHNDGAFWPAPETAKHEYGCWQKSMDDEESVSAFVSWSDAVCTEDHDREPFPDGGHNCPMKTKDGGKPEMPWVLVALKLYAQQDGSMDSKCYGLLWGDADDSLKKSPWADITDFREGAPKPTTTEFFQ